MSEQSTPQVETEPEVTLLRWEEHAALLDLLPGVFAWVCDLRGVTLWMNRAMREAMGPEADALIGQSVLDRWPERAEERLQLGGSLLLTGTPITSVEYLETGRWVRITRLPAVGAILSISTVLV